MKGLSFILALALVAVAAAVTSHVQHRWKSNLNTSYTAKFSISGFESIRIGDKVNEVTAVIGEPLEVFNDGTIYHRYLYSKPKDSFKDFIICEIRFNSEWRVDRKSYLLSD